MAEPTSSAAAAAMAGLGLASLLPWVDGSALMGASLGAALVAYSKSDLSALQRVGALIFSALCGYFMAPEIIAQTPVTMTAAAGFVGAIIIVPISLKAIEHIESMDISGLIERFKGGK